MAVINWVTPVDVSPTADSTWRDVDITNYVAAADQGKVAIAILRLYNTTTSTVRCVLRKNGSSDFEGNAYTINASSQTMYYVGVDSNDIFQCNLANSAGHVVLMGYITTDYAYSLLNKTSVATTTTGSYVNVDISGQSIVGDTAYAFFGLMINLSSSSAYYWNVRIAGSTDDRRKVVRPRTQSGVVIPCVTEIFEQLIENTNVDLYITGYLKTTGVITYDTTGNDFSTATTGSYVSTDISAAITSGDNAAIVEIYTNSAQRQFDLRESGSSVATYYYSYGENWLVKVSSGTFEQKIGNTDTDLWLLASIGTGVVAAKPEVFPASLLMMLINLK